MLFRRRGKECTTVIKNIPDIIVEKVSRLSFKNFLHMSPDAKKIVQLVTLISATSYQNVRRLSLMRDGLRGEEEYAIGPDPFQLPKAVRNIALERFGYDFDDEGSYPRAILRACKIHKGLGKLFLAHRETIFSELGSMMLPNIPIKDRRNLIKKLFACVELDGTFDTWKRDNNLPENLSLPLNHKNLTLIHLPNGLKFPVQTFFRQQHEKTEDLALRLPHLTDLISYWSKHEGGNSHPERTLKAEICCEWEALSRRAKVKWAISNGHDVLSLQHDGVVLGLRNDTPINEACECLQKASSIATAYHIPVTNKPIEIPSTLDTRQRVGAVGRPILLYYEPRNATPFGNGMGGGGG